MTGLYRRATPFFESPHPNRGRERPEDVLFDCRTLMGTLLGLAALRADNDPIAADPHHHLAG